MKSTLLCSDTTYDYALTQVTAFTLLFNRHLNTIIMSATIVPRPATLKENVTLAFRNLKVTNAKPKDYSGLVVLD